jgi:hypothetical protein
MRDIGEGMDKRKTPPPAPAAPQYNMPKSTKKFVPREATAAQNAAKKAEAERLYQEYVKRGKKPKK